MGNTNAIINIINESSVFFAQYSASFPKVSVTSFQLSAYPFNKLCISSYVFLLLIVNIFSLSITVLI